MKKSILKLKNNRTIVIDFESDKKQIRVEDRETFACQVVLGCPDTQQKADKLARYATRRLGYNETSTPLVYFEDLNQ